MNDFNKYTNNIHKGFSPYGGRSSLNNSLKEKEEVLAFAKKLQEKHLEQLKNFNSSKTVKKEVQKQQELDKKFEEQKNQYFERVKKLSNKDIQKSIEIAKVQNEKFGNKFDQNSSLDDLFNTLSDDLKADNK